jgi:hypothetical protein
MTKIDRLLAISAVALALVLSARAAGAQEAGPATKVFRMFGLGGDPAAGPPKNDQNSAACPPILVDGGSAELRSPPGADAASVRYQISILEVARECVVQGEKLAIKLGVAGAAVLGPLGQPGAYYGALRVGLRNVKTDSMVASKTYRVGATIPTGAARGEFTVTTETFFVPFENAGSAENFEILVGFAPAGAEAAKKPARRRKR